MADLFSMTPMEKKASKKCWDFDIRFYKVVRGQTDLKSPLTQVRLLMRGKSTLQWVPQQVARKQTKGALSMYAHFFLVSMTVLEYLNVLFVTQAYFINRSV